jgi:hypothetical protein
MSDTKVRASTVFTVGNGTSVEYFKAGSCPSATLRLPCTFVFANKEDMCL